MKNDSLKHELESRPHSDMPRYRPYYTHSSVGTMFFLKAYPKRRFIDRALTDPLVPGKYRAGVCIISSSIAFKRSELYQSQRRGERAINPTLSSLPNLSIDHRSIIKPCLVRFCLTDVGSLLGDNLDRSRPGCKAVQLPSRPFPSRISSTGGFFINITLF